MKDIVSDQTGKLLSPSCRLQLEELDVRSPVCSLIRSKDGITLYRVESEGKKLILKIFDKQEDTREIENYLMLSKLGIKTLPLLGCTGNAILLEDVEASTSYRLGKENDLKDPETARAIARWYKMLHRKGKAYLSDFTTDKKKMYDETDIITIDNMNFAAEKTGTVGNVLWEIIIENYDTIRHQIDTLDRTLTYNDFYWTNLIVSKNGDSAFMFDYNFLGKGIVYSDIRNVISALSMEAAEAFIQEYGVDINETEKKADAFFAPLVTLVHACRRETFPYWAKDSLKALKDGEILRRLEEWMGDTYY